MLTNCTQEGTHTKESETIRAPCSDAKPFVLLGNIALVVLLHLVLQSLFLHQNHLCIGTVMSTPPTKSEVQYPVGQLVACYKTLKK